MINKVCSADDAKTCGYCYKLESRVVDYGVTTDPAMTVRMKEHIHGFTRWRMRYK